MTHSDPHYESTINLFFNGKFCPLRAINVLIVMCLQLVQLHLEAAIAGTVQLSAVYYHNFHHEIQRVSSATATK